MLLLKNLPIRKKMTMIILTACATVLLISFIIMALYDGVEFRRNLVHDMTALADILGKNNRAALAFNDTNTANEILQALQAKPRVLMACLYDQDGHEFAVYVHPNYSGDPPPSVQHDGFQFKNDCLELFRPILLNDMQIGTIFLRTDLGQITARLRVYVNTSLMVLVVSLILAYVISARLQRPITQPILALANTSKKITSQQDYTLRAEKFNHDEIGHLADAFNDMIVQVQQREAALQSEISERQQAEESLRDSKAQIQTIVENLAEGVVVSDLNGQILYFNRAALNMHELDDTGDYRHSFSAFATRFELSTANGTLLSPDQWPLARILRGEKLTDLEFQIRRRNSTWERIYSYSGEIARDHSGGSLMAIMTIHDISEQKQADKKLQAQLSRLDLLSRITHAIGERQDIASIYQIVLRTLEENLLLDFTCVCHYDHGHNALIFNHIGVNNSGLISRIALVDQEQISIADGILARAVRGQLIYEPDLGQIDSSFPQRLFRAGLRSLVIAPLLVESKIFGVLIATRKEANSFSPGEYEFIGQLCKHVALAAHQVQLYESLQQAYNDLHQSQQTIMQQERLRALGQMASGIAHDINNALSPVSLYTESLLENEPNLSVKGRQYLETIQRAIDDVSHTIGRMREFYRQRDHHVEHAMIQINELIEQVIELTRARWYDMPQQRGHVIKIQPELEANLPAIRGSESEIREALTNLIFNAVDAMHEGGTLTLRTKSTPAAVHLDGTPTLSSVHLEVIDTGIGMSEEIRNRCLEPFYTNKGERGTGLGLAMVFGILQRHNADIEIHSQLGQGTTVRLVFPVPQTSVDMPLKSAVDQKSHTRIPPMRILIVDDDPFLIKSLADTLETDNHMVVKANGGHHGIELFQQAFDQEHPFDVVVTDLGMPNVDGRKVASAIKAISPATPVIMLTGWGQRLIAENDIPMNVDCVLNKPPKLQDLRQALARYGHRSLNHGA